VTELPAAATEERSLVRRPVPRWRFLYVVHRHYLVWRKLLGSALVGHLADPLIWLIGLGYGLGRLMPAIDGLSYLAFLSSGMVCYSAMNSASFEGLWSAFTRLKMQRTWESILHAPMTVADVVLGEWVWAALKGLLSSAAILLVMTLLGIVQSPLALWVLPLALLVGLTFAGLALIVTATAKSYDLFTYYFSLFLMPMTLVSGVFFPFDQLPRAVQIVAQFLPLTHATTLTRGLVVGAPVDNVLLHVAVLAIYAAATVLIAIRLVRKRLMS
jgi:lipooligosaccharide transport system permease protein